MAMGLEQIFLQTTVGTVFGQYFSLLFGGQESQAEREERIRRSFTEFLQLLSREFQTNTEQAIRAAFLDHSFEEIKTDCSTAINLFTQYAYTITRERPYGEEATLESASSCIERAASRVQILCDRICEEPLPVVDWTKPPEESRPRVIAAMRGKLSVLIKSFQTVASVRLLIVTKRAERHAGLRQAIVREIIPPLLSTLQRLDVRQREIQPLRINSFCRKEIISSSILGNQPLTFGNIELIGAQIHPKSPNTDEFLGIIEYTYDQTEKFKAFFRYNVANLTSVWAFRHYGPLPATWFGTIFLPPSQASDVPLPSQAAPGNSIVVPFRRDNLPCMGPPISALAEEIIRIATAKLIGDYEAGEYANLRSLRDLAERVSGQMTNT